MALYLLCISMIYSCFLDEILYFVQPFLKLNIQKVNLPATNIYFREHR